MKTRDKYAVGITVAFSLYAFALLWLAQWSILAALIFSLVGFFVALIAGYWDRLIVPLLIIALVALPLQSSEAWVKVPPPKQEAQPKWVVPVICGIVVIAVGGYVILKLIQLCNKVLPKGSPAPNPQSTNGVTEAIAPGPAPGPSPACFVPTWHSLDISEATNCAPYTVLSWVVISSSTNLTDWRPECTITQWWASSQSLVVVYTNGTPKCFSFSTSTPPTNYVEAVPMTTEPAKFFKCE